MKDAIIKGTGNSRYLKSVANFMGLYPTYEDFAAALIAGTLPVDFNGKNALGWTEPGTDLNKANLLSDETLNIFGLPSTTVPDGMWNSVVPPGSVFWRASETIPGGYLRCDGSALAVVNYPALYAVIGNKFGGDAVTFYLPNLQAAFIRGAGSQDGYSAIFGQKQEASSVNASSPGRVCDINRVGDKIVEIPNVWAVSRDSYTSVVTSFHSRPFNIALTPIIKY